MKRALVNKVTDMIVRAGIGGAYRVCDRGCQRARPALARRDFSTGNLEGASSAFSLTAQ